MTSVSFLIGLVIFYGTINTIFSQSTSQVASPENLNVKLTVTIPNTPQASDASLITIKHEIKDSQEDVLFLYKGFANYKLQDKYRTRITTNLNAANRLVEMTLANVVASDAGTFACYIGTGTAAIGNCGQKLIVLRKPNPPTINVLSPPLEGQTLKIECQPNSLSLPADHGLASEILWQDEQGQFIGIPGGDSRLNMNALGHLEFRGIQRSDTGRKFTCTSEDKVAVSYGLVSNRSPYYEVIPEFKPLVSDLVLTPPFESDAQIKRTVSEEINYKCDITCLPACSVQWTFKSFTATEYQPVPNLVDSKILKKSVVRSDEGIYRCMASNRHGEVHKDFELQLLFASTQNPKLQGKPFYVKDKGILNILDPYLSTTQRDHRMFTPAELSDYPKKDVPTFWECENYPKAWGHGLHHNPLPKDNVPRDRLPMRDEMVFKTATKIPRLPKAPIPVPHTGLKTLYDVSYQVPSHVNMKENYYCPVDTPFKLPEASTKSIYTAPKMYDTEYQNIGSRKPITVSK